MTAMLDLSDVQQGQMGELMNKYRGSIDWILAKYEGDKYKQWNAAFDAGFCAALGKPYITLHDEDNIHPLKEVDASALAWARSPEQVVEILKYVTST